MSTRQPKNQRKTRGAPTSAYRRSLAILDRAIPRGLPEGAAAVARDLLVAAARLERRHTEDDVVLGASTATLLLAYTIRTPHREWLVNWLNRVVAACETEKEFEEYGARVRAALRASPDPARPAGDTTKGKLQ